MGNAVVTQDPEVEAQTKVRADPDAGRRRMRLRCVKSADTVGFGLLNTRKQYDTIAKASEESIRRARKLSESWTVLAEALQSPFQGHNLASAGGWTDPTIAKQAAQLAEAGAKLAMLLQDYVVAAEAVVLGPSKDFLDGPLERAMESRRYYEQRRQKLDMRRNKNIDERSSDMVTALAKYDNGKRRFIESVKSVRSKTNQIMVRQVTLHTAAQAKIFSTASQYVQELGSLASDVCQLYNFRLQLPGTSDQEARLKKAGLKSGLPPGSLPPTQKGNQTGRQQQGPRPANARQPTGAAGYGSDALPAPEAIQSSSPRGATTPVPIGGRDSLEDEPYAEEHGATQNYSPTHAAGQPQEKYRQPYAQDRYGGPEGPPSRGYGNDEPDGTRGYENGPRGAPGHSQTYRSGAASYEPSQPARVHDQARNHPPPYSGESMEYPNRGRNDPLDGGYRQDPRATSRQTYPEPHLREQGIQYAPPPAPYQHSYDQQDPYGQPDGPDPHAGGHYRPGGMPERPPVPPPREQTPPSYGQPPVSQGQYGQAYGPPPPHPPQYGQAYGQPPPSQGQYGPSYGQPPSGYTRPPSQQQYQDPMMGDLLAMSSHTDMPAPPGQQYGVGDLSHGMANAHIRDQPPPVYGGQPSSQMQRKPKTAPSAADWRNPFA
eukprot:scaffold24_cov341-Pavlova_lutheri.AAC.42